MIALNHSLVNVWRTRHLLMAMGTAKDVHVVSRLLQIFQLAAAVHVVAAVDGVVVRAHTLYDEAILDNLIHIRLFLMHTLLQFVIRLLN